MRSALMSEGGERGATGWLAMFLPALVVVLFDLLRLRLRTPTAGGLAFLVAVVIAYLLFPKTRINLASVLAGGIIAVVVALLMEMFLTRAV